MGDEQAQPADAETALARVRSLRIPGPDRVPLAVIAAVIAFASLFIISGEKHFGPVDEFQHYDYITEIVYHHRIPLPGDVFTQQAMRAHACHAGKTGKPVSCHAKSYNPADFETNGRTTTGGYPPAYYVPTAIVAWVISKLIGTKDLFIAGRLASVIWLIAGAGLTYLLAKSIGLRSKVAAVVALVAGLSPMVLYQGSTINPDSMSLLAGSGVALAWLRWRRTSGAKSFAALTAVLAFVALIKPNFLAIPVAVVATEFALMLANRSPATARRILARVTVASLIALVIGIAWPAYLRLAHHGETLGAPPSAAYGAAKWSTDIALRGWANSLTPLMGLPKGLDHGPFVLLSAVIDLLLVAGIVAVVLVSRHANTQTTEHVDQTTAGQRELAWFAGIALIISAPVTYVIVAATSSFIIYPPRYSLYIVPLGIACLAWFAAVFSKERTG